MSKVSNKSAKNQHLINKSEYYSDVTHVSQRSYNFTPVSHVKHLNLQIFKLHPCPNPKDHNYKQCAYYHTAKDRKRLGEFYSSDDCPYIKQNKTCPDGEECYYSHSLVEALYGSSKYKTKFCSTFPQRVNTCEYGQFCAFAHTEEQIRCHLIHNYVEDTDFYLFYYKTEWCPFNLTYHNKKQCVYAHHWQDYRRNPCQYSYQARACIHWKNQDQVQNYESSCPNGFNCNMCHGWKQLYFHPNYYKTNKCSQLKCSKGSCHNYHSENERRYISTDIKLKIFQFVPKNRIVEGVFEKKVPKEGYKPTKKQEKYEARDKIKTTIKKNKVFAEQVEDENYRNKTTLHKNPKISSSDPQSQNWIGQNRIESEYDSSDQNVKSQVQKLII